MAQPKPSPIFTEAVAKLEGSADTPVRAKVTGYLVKQVYQDGAMVQPGELLFLIDPKPYHAELDTAQVSVSMTETNSAYIRITSPVAGIAERAMPGLGDVISPGMTLTTVDTVDPIKAVVTLPRKVYLEQEDTIAQALAISPGSRPETLDLTLADGSLYRHQGKWDSVDARAPGSIEPVTVSALFANPDLALRPGQYVKISEENR